MEKREGKRRLRMEKGLLVKKHWISNKSLREMMLAKGVERSNITVSRLIAVWSLVTLAFAIRKCSDSQFHASIRWKVADE